MFVFMIIACALKVFTLGIVKIVGHFISYEI